MIELVNRLGVASKYSVGALAVLCLWALAIITFIDVTGRDLFDAPFIGAYEITEILVAVVIFGALPSVTVSREHVVVDLFVSVLPKFTRPFLSLVITLAEVVFLGLICWRCWILASSLIEYNEVTAQLRIPVGIFVFFISIMAGLSCFLCLCLIFTKSFRPREG